MLRAILIGGTSHVGKTTFAEALAGVTGWRHLSTDHLARHPGRPWGEVPVDVREYYRARSPGELLAEVSHHYLTNVWPIARAMVQSIERNPFDASIIFEGSAILPEAVADAGFEHTQAIWLTATEPEISTRIRGSSDYANQGAAEQDLIDRFVRRSLDFNAEILAATHRIDLRRVDVSESDVSSRLLQEFAELAG